MLTLAVVNIEAVNERGRKKTKEGAKTKQQQQKGLLMLKLNSARIDQQK